MQKNRKLPFWVTKRGQILNPIMEKDARPQHCIDLFMTDFSQNTQNIPLGPRGGEKWPFPPPAKVWAESASHTVIETHAGV